MDIFKSLDQLNIHSKTSVALGNFDGLHIGHRRIMEDAIDSAKESGLKSLCFTFSNHPFNFILHRKDNDADAIKLICSEDEKIKLVEDMGFDILVNVPFDEAVMSMSADAFFKEIVMGKLNAGCVSVGFNYSYGARASGNADTLRSSCNAADIDINIHDAVKIDGEVVSSTFIREMISSGDMGRVKTFLGRAYSFKGRVEHGYKLGSANGIPTANISPNPEKMLPPYGVYFTRTFADDAEYKSVSNIGSKPTVNSGLLVDIETNIFDYEGDLYGKDIEVLFDHFSRPEMRFGSKEELFSQIRKDCINAKEYYKNR